MYKFACVVTTLFATGCVSLSDGNGALAIESCSLGDTTAACSAPEQPLVAGSDIASAPRIGLGTTYAVSGPAGGGQGFVVYTPQTSGTYVFYSDGADALQVCDLTPLCSGATGCATLTRATEEVLAAGELYQIVIPAGQAMRLRVDSLAPRPIVFAGTLDGQLATDLYTVAADGTTDQRFFTAGDEQFPSWAPDGERISYIRNGRLYVLAGPFGGETEIADSVGRDGKPAPATWSPDGSRLVYMFPRPRNFIDLGGGEIVDESYDTLLHLINADGTNDVELTGTASGTLASPAWGPDNRIAFTVADDCPDCAGGQRYGIINADGTGYQDVEPLMESDPGHLYPRQNVDWSPDGTRWVYTAHAREGDPESAGTIVTRSPDADDPVELTTTGAWLPRWSPDGTSIAFLRADGIYVMNADGTNQHRLLAATNVRGIDW